MNENSVIKIHDLHFSYGSPVILEDIQLDIKSKEFVGMVGPNGSGKTTLLKIILGLLVPDKGSVEVLGKQPHQAVKKLAICHSLLLAPEISPLV